MREKAWCDFINIHYYTGLKYVSISLSTQLHYAHFDLHEIQSSAKKHSCKKPLPHQAVCTLDNSIMWSGTQEIGESFYRREDHQVRFRCKSKTR